MPYEGEFAKYRSIRRLVESKRVQNLMERARKIQDQSSAEVTLEIIKISEIPTSKWNPRFIIGIDGSGSAIRPRGRSKSRPCKSQARDDKRAVPRFSK